MEATVGFRRVAVQSGGVEARAQTGEVFRSGDDDAGSPARSAASMKSVTASSRKASES